VKVILVKRDWLEESGLRLEASGYTTGSREIKEKIRRSKYGYKPLASIAKIFNGPRFARVYIEDSDRSVPFLSNSDMLLANFAGIKYLSRKYTPALDEIRLKQGWTLISCSGTVGNTVYVRPDMDGMTGSQHIMRVAPLPDSLPSGYLYSFLSSPLAKAMIQEGTYGSVIQHIEPNHITDLPIPSLPTKTQRRIHELVERAAALRVEAANVLKASIARMERQVIGLPKGHRWKYGFDHARAIEIAPITAGTTRLDAFHHVGYAREGVQTLKQASRLGELVRAYQPSMFKRPYTDKENGIPFLSGVDLYDVIPQPRLYISKRMPGLENYIVKAGTILVQSDGQRYGLFGRPMILPKHLDGSTVTQHLMRLHPHDPKDRGFVYVYLLAETGRRALLRQSFGTSMGALFENSFHRTEIPDCKPAVRYSFEDNVAQVITFREQAYQAEIKAQSILLAELET